MSDNGPKAGRHFTEAARKAAALARKAKLEEPRRFGEPELFVVRPSEAVRGFAWQIRQFGGIVLATGDVGFPTSAAAREAGRQALEGLETS